jgi:hypothetical protein
VFVRAGRLVRAQGQPDLLRGLGVRQLDVPSMTLGPGVELPGDVRQLALWFSENGAAGLEVARPDGEMDKFHFNGQALEPAGAFRGRFSAETHRVVLTAAGVGPTSRVVTDAACGFAAQDERDAQGLPRIRISAGKSKGFFLDARYGSGLAGLPFPAPRSAASKTLSPAGETR